MVTVMLWVWLGVFCFSVVFELITLQLTTIWFAIGSLVSMLLSLIPNFHFAWQILIFAVVSSILIITLRKITKKWLCRKSDGKTNLDLIIGKDIKVINGCDSDTVGSAKLNDVVWSIQEVDGKKIESGEYATIVQIKGNKLIVKKDKAE